MGMAVEPRLLRSLGLSNLTGAFPVKVRPRSLHRERCRFMRMIISMGYAALDAPIVSTDFVRVGFFKDAQLDISSRHEEGRSPAR